MDFSELAVGTLPYLSYGKNKADYFTELIGSFLKDSVMDSCPLLKKQNDTKYRYVKGTRDIQPKDAQYLYDHRDMGKFEKWVWNRMDESDSYDGLMEWLESKGIRTEEPDAALAKLMESIVLELAGGDKSRKVPQESLDADFRLIDEIEQKILGLHKPKEVPVPGKTTADEQTYIEELMMAYGDAEGVDGFSEENLRDYPEYAEDLADRRVDFYAAETIKQGVRELGKEKLSDQFDVLKSETYQGVKDTARRSHPNGYERMLAVMEQAVNTPVSNYLLGKSPYWISNGIKKGVCHHLVNDGKLRWVKRRRTP